MANLKSGDIPGLSSNGALFLETLGADLAQVKTAVNQLIADFNAHTHGGVTAGAAATAAPTATTAQAISVTETTDPAL
jgi:hypothetical protein